MNNISTEGSFNELEYRIVSIWCKVLDLEFVNLSDDFFHIGGHSRAATRMLFLLKVQMGVEVTLKEFFQHTTLMAFTGLVNFKLKTPGLPTSAGNLYEDQDHYPVSYAQKRLWRLHKADPHSLPAYNMTQCYRINGALQIPLLNRALENLVSRHHGLLTHFAEIDDEVRQRVGRELPVAIDYRDFTSETQVETIWNEAASSLNKSAFDLINGPLFQTNLYKVGKEEYILIFVISHIIADEWSMGILVSELISLYRQANLKTPILQPKDFAIAESKSFTNGESEKFWLKQFDSPFEPLDLPTIKSRPAHRTYTGGIQSLYLPGTIRSQLLEKSAVLNTSLFITFLGMVQAFISRWTGSEDIILGVPFSCRINGHHENQVGCYINTLAIRTKIMMNDQLDDILRSASYTNTEALENGTYPFDALLSNLSLPVHPGRSPLFDILVFQDNHKNTSEETLNSGITFCEIPIDFGVSKYDLTISFKDDQDGLIVDFNYNQEIIDQDVVDRLVVGFGSFMRDGLDGPNLPLKDLNILGGSEKEMIRRFSQGSRQTTPEKTIDELFQVTVEKHPYRIALTEKDLNLTYDLLDKKTNSLCAFLKQEYGVGKGDRVVIVAKTRIPYFLGMLASAKLGAIYVALDYSLPEEKIMSVLEDCDPRIIISDETRTWCRIPALDVLNSELFSSQTVERKPADHRKVDPMCISYTSGTTGKPKGVIVPHAGIVNLCTWHKKSFHLDKETIATQYASPGFDAMGWEIWPYLITGGRIEVVPESLKLDSLGLLNFYRERNISHTYLPTAVFEQLDAQDHQDVARQLTVLTGGDQLRVINQTLPVAFNCYGPTEYSVVATSGLISAEQEQITIGGPIDNTQIYILSSNGERQPVKTPGEVCIGGEGLALGYWQDEKQTQSKFRMNKRLSQRIYHTGDLAYWDNEGRIVYLRREDNQIQIGGFRVELGEIQCQLLRINRVTRCAVIADESTEGLTLKAFYTALTKTDVDEVRTQLKQVLPHYMVPEKIAQVQQMPLNASGKIDRKALLMRGNTMNVDEEEIPFWPSNFQLKPRKMG